MHIFFGGAMHAREMCRQDTVRGALSGDEWHRDHCAIAGGSRDRAHRRVGLIGFNILDDDRRSRTERPPACGIILSGHFLEKLQELAIETALGFDRQESAWLKELHMALVRTQKPDDSIEHFIDALVQVATAPQARTPVVELMECLRLLLQTLFTVAKLEHRILQPHISRPQGTIALVQQFLGTLSDSDVSRNF